MDITSRSKLFLLIILLIISTITITTNGQSCSKQSDCGGSDIKYRPCVDGSCDYCDTNDECSNRDDDVCNDTGFCSLAGFFSPFDGIDIAATLVILIGAMIAAGGGLGGGGIFIPVYVLILSMKTSSAAALSQATIFGGSIVNLVMNFRVRHPRRPHRPLPDLYTILIFEPMLLGGTIIGVIFNVILPEPITLSCLVVTLSYAAYRTLRKGVNRWKKETADALHEAITASALPLQKTDSEENNENENENENDINNNGNDNSDTANSDNENKQINGKNSHDRRGTETNNSRMVPLSQRDGSSKDTNNNNNNSNPAASASAQSLGDNSTSRTNLKSKEKSASAQSLSRRSTSRFDIKIDDYSHDPESSSENTEKFLIYACGLTEEEANKPDIISNLKKLIPLIDEEKQIKRPLLITLGMWLIVSLFSIFRRLPEQCGIGYWFLTMGIFPFLFFLSFYLSKKQVNSYTFKIKYNWKPCEGDIKWQNYKQAMLYSSIAGIAGLLGGLLGIGGGMIISPLLLELKVLPRVASATSAMAVLVTSSSATLQFLLIDMLAYDYMLFFMSIGIIGTFLGQTIVNHCIKKYGRTSVVALSIGTVIALAVLLMGLKGLIDIINGDSTLVFSSLC